MSDLGWLEIAIIIFVLVGFTSTVTFRIIKLLGSSLYLRIKLRQYSWKFIRKIKPDPFEEVHFEPKIYGDLAGRIQAEKFGFSNHYKIEIEQNSKRYSVWIKIRVGQFVTTIEYLNKNLINE